MDTCLFIIHMTNNFSKNYLISNKFNYLKKELKNTQSSLKLNKGIKITDFLKVENKIS